MDTPRVIITEGIMGSGKATTAAYLADQFQRHQIPAQCVFEGTHPHPVRLIADLPHPFQPWLDVTSDTYIARSQAKWRAFVAQVLETDTVTVFDGQLFHGDFTHLFMMDTPLDHLYCYIEQITTILIPLQAAVIYFYQRDIAHALQRVFSARGPEWKRYQVDWKTRSPYCIRHDLQGFDGLVQMYIAYRSVTDACIRQLPLPTLRIETSAGDWPDYYHDILGFVGLESGV